MKPLQNSVDGPSEARLVARQAEAELEEFVYVVSHDFKASVRALRELPSWIEDDLRELGQDVPDNISETISMMHTHANRLDRMLLDLLVYSRVGRKSVPEMLDLVSLIPGIISKQSIATGFSVNCDMKCAQVIMDPGDFETLLGLLLDNAVRHHDRPAGRILVRTVSEAGLCVLTVEDDGPGIASKDHEAALQKMMVLQPRDEIDGSGMGLAIAGKIASFCGGRLELGPSAMGRGLRVTVTLPMTALKMT